MRGALAYGIASKSNSVGLLRAGDAAFAPTAITGLQVWLKTDAITGLNNGEAVSTWNDSSGNGRNFTQATGTKQPIYNTNVQNGLPAITFDSTDDSLVSSFSVSALPFTAIVVYKWDSGGNFRRALEGSNNWLIGPYGGSGLHQFYNGGFISSGVSSSTVVRAVVTQATGDAKYYLNGVLRGSNTNNNAPLTLGLGAAFNGEPLCGKAFEVIIYNSVISSNDFTRIDDYLKVKWNLT